MNRAFRKSEPAVEAVGPEDAKDFSKILDDENTSQLQAFTVAARRLTEDYLSGCLLTTSWIVKYDRFPSVAGPERRNFFKIPRPPLQSITHVKYYNSDGVLTTIADTDYIVDSHKRPGVVEPASGKSWPGTDGRSSAIEIEFVAGWDDRAKIPEELLIMVKMLASNMNENRRFLSLQEMAENPTFEHLGSEYRIVPI